MPEKSYSVHPKLRWKRNKFGKLISIILNYTLANSSPPHYISLIVKLLTSQEIPPKTWKHVTQFGPQLRKNGQSKLQPKIEHTIQYFNTSSTINETMLTANCVRNLRLIRIQLIDFDGGSVCDFFRCSTV